MKKEYKHILLILLLVLALTVLKKPLEFLLLNLNYNTLKCNLIAGSISRLIMIVGAIWAIKKWGLEAINGFSPKFSIKNYQALIIPFAIIVIMAVSSLKTYQSVSIPILLLFLTSMLMTGFAEELTFRGIILPLILRANINKKGFLLRGLIFSSLLFGLIHYINFVKTPYFDLVTSKVIFAFCIGGLLGGLFLRTGNILSAAIWHGLFNFAFSTDTIRGVGLTERLDKASKDLETDWGGILITLAVWLAVFGCGVVMTRLSDKEVIAQKIKQEC